jgi:hypothetical protein
MGRSRLCDCRGIVGGLRNRLGRRYDFEDLCPAGSFLCYSLPWEQSVKLLRQWKADLR